MGRAVSVDIPALAALMSKFYAEGGYGLLRKWALKVSPPGGESHCFSLAAAGLPVFLCDFPACHAKGRKRVKIVSIVAEVEHGRLS